MSTHTTHTPTSHLNSSTDHPSTDTSTSSISFVPTIGQIYTSSDLASVPHTYRQYKSHSKTYTSDLGVVTTTCIPTTTVTAAPHGKVSTTVIFGECGPGIGPMVTESIHVTETVGGDGVNGEIEMMIRDPDVKPVVFDIGPINGYQDRDADGDADGNGDRSSPDYPSHPSEPTTFSTRVNARIG
ncbi:hypothetical protein B0A52_09730 [Exophiala mesophila]|uniref:Uncharacterized protein n=1 Tax=Exophiala mesophila TaxID=212818 RepID=A0A438MTR8_EXOME|nr:hypothetical protein B0A52_09730 [Exophiala mesophila]